MKRSRTMLVLCLVSVVAGGVAEAIVPFIVGALCFGGALFFQTQEIKEEICQEELAERRIAHEREVAARVTRLVRHYEHFPMYADESFIAGYAAAHKDDLLKRRRAITDAYVEFHQQSPEIVAALKKRWPETYERHQFEIRALAMAERLAVKPALPPGSAPTTATSATPPRRKPTPEEFRAIACRREEIRLRDALAKQEVRLKFKGEAMQMLDGYELSDDERARYEQALDEAIDAEDANRRAETV